MKWGNCIPFIPSLLLCPCRVVSRFRCAIGQWHKYVEYKETFTLSRLFNTSLLNDQLLQLPTADRGLCTSRCDIRCDSLQKFFCPPSQATMLASFTHIFLCCLVDILFYCASTSAIPRGASKFLRGFSQFPFSLPIRVTLPLNTTSHCCTFVPHSQELGTGGDTICQAGCAMSSVAMLLTTRGRGYNPGTLNSWLKGNGGYAQGDLMYVGLIRIEVF